MSTSVNYAASATGSGGASGNSLGQITSNPAALAQNLIYEIMALYGQIIQLEQQQKQNMTQAQAAQAKAESDATLSAANADGWSTFAAGALSIVGAGLQWAGSEGFLSGNRGKVSEMSQSREALEAQAKPMKVIDSAMLKDPATASLGVPSNPADVTTRTAQLKAGQYDYSGAESHTLDAVAEMKRAGGADWDNFKSDFTAKSKQISEDLNTKARDIANTTQSWGNTGQMLGGAFNAGGNISSGVGKQQAGQGQAEAVVDRMAGQMAASSAGDFGQAMAKAYDAQNAEIQILDAIRRASQTN